MMARPKGNGAEVGKRLVAAAGRGFRTGGFGGIGVDALAGEAGLTSGAFYAHFGSKAVAFREAVRDGLQFTLASIQQFQENHGPEWQQHFARFYLGERMDADLPDACIFQTLTPDIARSDLETRQVYSGLLSEIISSLAHGFDGDRDRAWAFWSLLTGAGAMTRATTDAKAREEALQAVLKAALKV